MSIFDSLKRTAESTLKKEAAKAVNNAVQSVGKGKNRSESLPLLYFRRMLPSCRLCRRLHWIPLSKQRR